MVFDSRHTHYVPALTVAWPDATQQAVCGTFVWPEQHVRPDHAPSCWGCALWLDNLDVIVPAAAPASPQALITERAFHENHQCD